MSSSFRKATLAVGLLSIGASAAYAQQYQFIPTVELTGEYNTNRSLNPVEDESSQAYKALLEGRWVRTTPRSDTEFLPRIRFQEYPDESRVDSMEGLAELRTDYRFLKGSVEFKGFYRQQDTFSYEYGDTDGPELDPNGQPVPDSDGASVVVPGNTRTSWQVEPTATYLFTERTSVELLGRFDAARYESETPGEREGFESPHFEASVVRRLSPASRVSFGPYWAKYESRDGENETETIGASLSYRYEWTKIDRTTLVLNYEQNDVYNENNFDQTDEVSAWGVEWIGTRKLRVGNIRYAVGRFLEPSSIGSRREVDRLRVTYSRPLSPRLFFRGTTRMSLNRELGNTTNNESDRDQANLELMLRYNFTPTFYVSPGYKFAWQDVRDSGSAESHGVFLSFGYRGLDERERF